MDTQMFSLGKSANDLLAEATQKKKEGNLEAAVDLLRQAYEKIKASSLDYSPGVFLRLPMYLQELGRTDEAWGEFNRLLTHGYPNQLKIPELMPMAHAAIYDKMRLFLQRKKKHSQAVKFGVLSYLSEALGLYEQKRKEELDLFISPREIESQLSKLLKKTGRSDLIQRLSELVSNECKTLRSLDVKEVAHRIDEIVR